MKTWIEELNKENWNNRLNINLQRNYRSTLDGCDIFVYLPVTKEITLGADSVELSWFIRQYGYERNWINLGFFIDQENNIIESGYIYPLSEP